MKIDVDTKKLEEEEIKKKMELKLRRRRVFLPARLRSLESLTDFFLSSWVSNIAEKAHQGRSRRRSGGEEDERGLEGLWNLRRATD